MEKPLKEAELDTVIPLPSHCSSNLASKNSSLEKYRKKTEYVAAQSFLDHEFGRPDVLAPNDNNDYILGKIGGHHVVIAVFLDGEYGTSSATSVARDMLHSFPNIRFGLLVGVGGGVPSSEHDNRLGDIVVSSSQGGGHGGVIQYDFGKELQEQRFEPAGFLNRPPTVLRTAVNGLKAQYQSKGHQLEEAIKKVLGNNRRMKRKYKRPDSTSDTLFESHVIHPSDREGTCAEICDTSKLITRKGRDEDEDIPAIHYGLIASGNMLIKNAKFQDKLALEQNILCFEMEAACLMNHFPCLVIRGICDYADFHKNKEWQGYAAMAAAAYAKDLLCRIVPGQVEAEKPAREILYGIQDQLDKMSMSIDTAARYADRIDQKLELDNLPIADGAEFDSYRDQHEDKCLPGTREQLRRQVLEWSILPEGKCIFWLNGVAGTGKGEGDRGNAARAFPAITRQLFTRIPELLPAVKRVLEKDSKISTKPLKDQFETLGGNRIRNILQLLPQVQVSKSARLRIFVTSRPELPIRLGFGDVGNHHQDLILHDVLLTMSVPLFIVAATMCRLFEDHNLDPEQRLDEILKNQNQESQLDGTYLPVFSRLLASYQEERRDRPATEIQQLVGIIILLETPLSAIALAKLMNIELSSIRVKLSPLHSVLNIPNDEAIPVRPFHLSFKEVLLHPRTRKRSPIWVDKKQTHQILTEYRLDFMCKKLRKNICNLQSYGTERRDINTQSVSHYLPPELQYSCRYWTYHLAQSKDPQAQTDTVLAFLDAHFLHWAEVMSILGIVSESVGCISILQFALQGNHPRLRILQDAKRSVMKNIHIANIAPLQLYASGLIFAPTMVTARGRFGRELPDWLSRGPKVEDDWGPELQTLEGHSDSVQSMAFSPDGQLLASGADDGTIKLWGPATGILKHTISTHGKVTNIGFSMTLIQLITNLGTFNIEARNADSSSRSSRIRTEVSLQLNRWVTIQGRRELWIPPEYLPTSSAVNDSTIAFGCRNGRICVISFSV
ncbi:WD domain protein [Aspergillus spinulosporus]